MTTKASAFGIQAPCTLDWSKMTPAEGGRFCGDCKKVVRDLSTMTEREARALVAKQRYEGLCVRMLVDRDGNVFFGGDRLVSASLLSKAKRAAVAAATIALPLASSACSAVTEPLGITSQEQEQDEDELQPLMGGVAIDPRDEATDAGADASDAGADATDAGADASDASDAMTDGGADASADDAGTDVILY